MSKMAKDERNGGDESYSLRMKQDGTYHYSFVAPDASVGETSSRDGAQDMPKNSFVLRTSILEMEALGFDIELSISRRGK